MIDAEHLSLEPQTVAHAEDMFAVLSDPAIYEYENEPPPSLEWLSARFAKLESRHSADGSEQWLNWVVRLPTSALAGYVQATIGHDGQAAIAYIFSSAYWGRGLAREAVAAMIAELAGHYGVRGFVAVLKRDNFRSSRSRGGAMHHVGIATDDLDEMVRRMKRHGHVFRNAIRDQQKFRYIMTAGPDDLLIELFQSLEPRRWQLKA